MNSKIHLSPTSATTRRISRVAAALAPLLLAAASVAHATDWSWTVTPYAWATDVGVDVRLGGREVVDREIPVSDLIEDLETIAQVRVEAQKGAYGVMLDLFDVTLSDDASGVELPQGSGEADIRSDVGMTILDVAGSYDPRGDKQGFVFLFGARILDERATIEATIEPASGSTVEEGYEADDTLLDALAGVRFSKRLTRHWGCQMQSDISTGGTDYTWSVGPSLSYAFGQSGRYALTAGYRYMMVDFDDEGDLDTEMTLSGLLVGFRMSF